MKRNHLPSIQSQNVLVRNGKMGIIAMRVRIDLRDTTYKGKEIQCKSKGERERERESERTRWREGFILVSHNTYVNVGMNFISIFPKFSAIK